MHGSLCVLELIPLAINTDDDLAVDSCLADTGKLAVDIEGGLES